MKNFIKGILCGILIMALIMPSLADDIPILFNQVRICVDGKTVASWEENIYNTSSPTSITCQGTTYVPIRFISDKMYKDVLWNGDSKTVCITDKTNRDHRIAEKADSNGNVWTYYTMATDNHAYYLCAYDKNRVFERRYRILGGIDAYKVTDNEIWFVKSDGTLYRLPFSNDINSQDGEEITHFNDAQQVLFDGDYLYIVAAYHGTSEHSILYAFNLSTKDTKLHHSERWTYIRNMKIKYSDENTAILQYTQESHGPDELYEITISKKDLTIGTPEKAEEI